jgi:hypothetical protein
VFRAFIIQAPEDRPSSGLPSKARLPQKLRCDVPAECGVASALEGRTMYKALNGALVALALSGVTLAGATLAISTPATAQIGVGVHVGGIGVGVNVGDVAFGYEDGYWDNGHHWHAWRNRGEMRAYRNAHRDQYNNYRHDRDPDQGWHR